ncbi:MAG: XRE family transcriptional regulator [Bosea sp. (in: a-proteobacteria)]|uniref:XRE family transcriptional regulator n=1 Tax=Bosea sp. (in: a-proteobacteria) TaxID=1871050 RepID=UPI0027375F40|nr:XRE family transcriptional regulator [Bosea sp. (in: a-proteobacteria)]MDP3600060.1 XRE family transcriptional regulator [Bosea sp. (in: a-proteobacteria)]
MKRRSGRPFAHTHLPDFIEKRILEFKPHKTQLAIANEAGFTNPSMLAMIKNGAAKLPLDRVASLAKALECDPVKLFTLALEQLDRNTTEQAIRQIFGTLVTENEVAWIEEIRRASDHSDPSLTARGRSAIRGIFGR